MDIGSKAPEFIAEDELWLNTEEGKEPSLESLEGNVVLIKFWSFMCSWCQQDLPRIAALGKKYAENGLVVLGIHTPETEFEENLGALKQQMKDLNVEFPVLTDNGKKNWEAYGPENWPAYYLVDQEGNIAFHILGPGAEEKLEAEIKKLVG